MLNNLIGRGQNGGERPRKGGARQHPAAGDRAGAWRRRRARIRPYRHHPDADCPWHRSQRRGRHLDRRGGRRRLCGRPSRYARRMGAQPAAAQYLRLSRYPPQRFGPDRRRKAGRAAGSHDGPDPDRGLAAEICHRGYRSPHRPRDLADPWPHGRRDARFLRAARDILAGAGGRPLAGRRRAWSIRFRCRRRARSARKS